MYYLCSKNKRADQLCGYYAADRCLCFPMCSIKADFLMRQLKCGCGAVKLCILNTMKYLRET